MDAEDSKAGDCVVARYHRQYGRQDKIFRLFDRLLGAFVPNAERAQASIPRPRRILLVNAGYLGDVIISTGLLPVLHHAFPGVEIGFLTGHYSKVVVEAHPLIARTHFIDHWYLSRAASPRSRRLLSYFGNARAMVRELRAANYDIAIDVRNWYPNLVPLLWMAGIPIRVAFDRVGCAPLLTHRLTFRYDRRHEFDHQLDLLRAIGVTEQSLATAWPTLAPPSRDAAREAKAVLGHVIRFRILHPTASTATRDWPLQNWRALAADLVAAGITPVITGAGRRDAELGEAIGAGTAGCVNAVNRLSWGGLLALIQRAEAVYAVETSVGHAASALHRPVVSIYGGMADPNHWAPLGAAIATNRIVCHPCLHKSGCAERACLTGTTVGAVQAMAEIAIHARAQAAE